MNLQEFWKRFKASKIVLNIETHQRFKTFMDICDERNVLWSSGKKPQEVDVWGVYGKDTCVLLERGGLVYGAIKHFNNGKYSVIKSADIFYLKNGPELSEADKSLLKRIPTNYKWITCDKNGAIYAHKHKPVIDDKLGVWYDTEDDSLFLLNKIVLPDILPWCQWRTGNPWYLLDILAD